MNLVPSVVGAAVLPLWITVTLLMLRGEGGVARAGAFAAGAMAVRLAQGVLVGVLIRADPGATQKSDLVAATVLVVVGIGLIVTAARAWLREEDSDAPPPRWMTALAGLRPLSALGLGAIMMTLAMKQWIFTLSAVAVIDESDLGRAGGIAAYLAFVLGAHSLILTPIVLCAATPARAARILETVLSWLERNGRTVTVAASLVFGLWFLRMGATGLRDAEEIPWLTPTESRAAPG